MEVEREDSLGMDVAAVQFVSSQALQEKRPLTLEEELKRLPVLYKDYRDKVQYHYTSAMRSLDLMDIDDTSYHFRRMIERACILMGILDCESRLKDYLESNPEARGESLRLKSTRSSSGSG